MIEDGEQSAALEGSPAAVDVRSLDAAAPSPLLPTSVLVGALAVLAVCGFCGTAFAPYLLVHQPLGLVALNPLWRHLILASPSIDTVPFFAVALVRMFLPDPFMYEIGRRFGPRALGFLDRESPSAGRVARVVERLFNRAGLLVLFLNPTLSVCALAGVARIPYGRFVVVNILGTLMQIALIRLLGEAFIEPIQLVLDFVSRHVRVLTLVSVAFAFLSWALFRRR